MPPQKNGDLIESTSYNKDKCDKVRSFQYLIDDQGAFVCHNGKNGYTRALSGGHREFRLETSDVPVFATYRKRDCHNISFEIVVDGRQKVLHETDDCMTGYKSAMRNYVLHDASWGTGTQ